jgi:ArsR family transcriptional regulator
VADDGVRVQVRRAYETRRRAMARGCWWTGLGRGLAKRRRRWMTGRFAKCSLSPIQLLGLTDGAFRIPRDSAAKKAETVAPMLKALADPVRLQLMSLIASHAGGEACVCELNDAFDLTQPTISHHLKVLHDSGPLDREKRGVWVYYRTRTQALANLGTLIGR